VVQTADIAGPPLERERDPQIDEASCADDENRHRHLKEGQTVATAV
jgi:hypothetical protein